MKDILVLKKDPKIEFQFLENGFQLIDEQTKENSGFYSYQDLNSVELNKLWFPFLAKFLRTFTWILNGVPFFPDGESYKKANVIIQCKENKLGIWLTETYMTGKAKILKKKLEKNLNTTHH